jgi:hypothetical protein
MFPGSLLEHLNEQITLKAIILQREKTRKAYVAEIKMLMLKNTRITSTKDMKRAENIKKAIVNNKKEIERREVTTKMTTITQEKSIENTEKEALLLSISVKNDKILINDIQKTPTIKLLLAATTARV